MSDISFCVGVLIRIEVISGPADILCVGRTGPHTKN